MLLRHRILFLLVLPLVCQIVFGVVLLSTIARIDAAAAKESHAKQIIVCAQDIRSKMSGFLRVLMVQRFMASDERKERFELFRIGVDTDMQALARLVDTKETQTAAILQKYRQCVSRTMQLLLDAETGFDAQGYRSSRFIETAEFTEEMSLTLINLMNAEDKFIDTFRPIVHEFQPQQLYERERLRTITIWAMIANSTIVLILALTFWKDIMLRLKRLMSNIDAFSREVQPQLSPVGGRDELTKLDQEFRRMAAERQRGEQMRRTLFAMVSHDLRSPLTSAGISLESVIIQANDLEPRIKAHLQRLRSDLKRVIRMASDFLDLERFEQGKFELRPRPVTAEFLVSESFAALNGLSVAKKVSMESKIEGSMDVNCDSERIIQVIVNLVANALKFSRPGEKVELRVLSSSDKARFEIIDSGPGIPESERGQLFCQFSQIEDSNVRGEGTGLGLFICKMLIEAHNGSIGVICPPTGGSCFWFEIPQTQCIR